ncbi:MAG: hypothetical protein U0P45_03895 [Acidimicrobiales bacterium]
MSELETGFRLGDVVGMVRRQLPVVLGASIVGLILGYLVFASAPESYSATSRVQVKAIKVNPFDPDNKANEPDIATEKDLVKSDAVADVVRAQLGLPADARVGSHISVTTTDVTSDVLQITYVAATAQDAQKGANAAAAGYLKQRKDAASSTRDKAAAALDQQIQEANDNLSQANDAVDAAKDGTPEKRQAVSAQQAAQSQLNALNQQKAQLAQFDPSSVGVLVKKATLPPATTSKKAMGKGIGVFGLCVAGGLVAAWFLDRRDGLGGGRRKIEQLAAGANIRVLPGADGRSASPAEVDAAIDRLAVDLVGGGMPGKATSVLIVGAGMEPPVALAEELASSLAFAGIPALFVLAGTSERQPRQVQTIASFADLVTSGASVAGPAGLPANAGEGTPGGGPLVTWLRPKGSAEASGLLRRAVVDSLVTRAGRERFEAVVFVAPDPTKTAAAAALGQWVERTAMVVDRDDRGQAEAAVESLASAEVRVTEVVFT